jgi:hypothetical protein
MDRFTISASSEAREYLPVLMCLHQLLNRLPVTARSRDQPGLRIEDGRVVDDRYTGPVLEEVIARNILIKTTPKTGPYKGVPVIVAPLQSDKGEAIGAIGVVDISGIFDLATLMEHQTMILKQVCGKDPCPLPTEQIPARR